MEYQTYILLSDRGANDIDLDEESHVLFVTYEFKNVIELVHARTMNSAGEITAAGASNLCGIVVHQINENLIRIYANDRSTDKLFCYNWDPDNLQLTLTRPDPNDPDNPNYGQHVDYFKLFPADPNHDAPIYSCGLALDNINNILYVSQISPGGPGGTATFTTIYAYDPNDYFRYLKTIDLGPDNDAIGIRIDSPRGYLYAGGYFSHPYLLKYDLNKNDPNVQKLDISAGSLLGGVIGLAVDQQSGYTYTTTYAPYGDDDDYQLQAWNCTDPFDWGPAAWVKLDAQPIKKGAGLCVADTDYVPPISLDITAEPNDYECVALRDEQITYTICWRYLWNDPADPDSPASDFDPTDFTITACLPEEIDPAADLTDPNANPKYNPENHSVTWTIGSVSPGAADCHDLTVNINNRVTPGGTIDTTFTAAYDIDNQSRANSVSHQMAVCPCTSSTIIYVDQNAQGNNDGSSWQNAFNQLTDALAYARSCGDQIWVAACSYCPSATDPNAAFDLINNIALLGGFTGYEDNVHNRNWVDNQTLLSGTDNLTLVRAQNLDNSTIIDGFTISNALVDGIYCFNASPTICHNKIKENHWGIVVEGRLAQPIIKNNWIYNNQAEGILLNDPNQNTIIRNNTIVANGGGICLETGDEPVISNCIFRFHPEANDVVNCTVKYSCLEDTRLIYDPTDPNSINRHNICTDPNFVDAPNHDYHLNSVSPCIDAGDPDSTCELESDIDGQYRIINDNIDIGADEYCPGDDSNPADFNADGAVDLLDYSELANVWLLENTDPGWNALYDLVADHAINLPDLDAFGQNWLWLACWNNTPQYFSSSQNMSMGMGLSLPLKQTLASTETSLPSAPLTPEQQIQLLMENITFLEEIWESSDDVRQTFTPQQWSDWLKSISNQILELEGE